MSIRPRTRNDSKPMGSFLTALCGLALPEQNGKHFAKRSRNTRSPSCAGGSERARLPGNVLDMVVPVRELVASARSDDASLDLAVDTVALALRYFRDAVLAQGKWDRTAG